MNLRQCRRLQFLIYASIVVTSRGRAQLRDLNMSRLKKYANAYNLDTKGALEKDEFIDALIAARQPNGCLPPNLEVRQYSYP